MQVPAALDIGCRVNAKVPLKVKKVLIVDDSKFFRRVVRQIITSSPSLEIVGEASNGVEALDMVAKTDPDVVTLDVNMPVMGGIKALKHLMIKSPKPTVMFSSLTKEGASETFDALKFGAIDFITKPSRLSMDEMASQQEAIVRKIRMAANVRVEGIRLVRTKNTSGKLNQATRRLPLHHAIVLGASEGGYGSFLKIAPQLDPAMPAAFIGLLYAEPEHVDSFVDYLDNQCAINVRRARNNEFLQGGTFYLVCGKEYATVEMRGRHPVFIVHPAPFPNRNGSIDMLMFSVAENMKDQTIGVILSGSGRDGSEGVHEIHRVGGTVFVQSPKTCLVKEMPLSAIGNCRESKVINDSQIATEINQFFQ